MQSTEPQDTLIDSLPADAHDGLLAVALCDLAMMSLAVAINLLPIFLTHVSHDLGGVRGLSDEQLGRIEAIIFAGLITGIVIASPLADRLGARLFAVGGNVLIAAGLAVLNRAGSYAVLLAGAYVMGLGAGTLDMILSPIVSALRPRRRTAAMNLLHSFYCVGAVVTILIGTLAVRSGVSWRAVSLYLLPMPLIVGAAFLVVRLPPLVEERQARTPLKTLLAHPFMLMALAAIFLGGATELGMAYWLPTYAEKSLRFPAFQADMAFLGFSIAMTVGRLAIAALPHRVGPIPLMLVCCAASLALFLLGSFLPFAGPAVWCCILVGLTGSCLWPSTLAVAADRFPRGGATMFGLLAALGNVGGVFMPWAIGAVADHSSLRRGLAAAAFCPLLMIPLLLWMWKHRGGEIELQTSGLILSAEKS